MKLLKTLLLGLFILQSTYLFGQELVSSTKTDHAQLKLIPDTTSISSIEPLKLSLIIALEKGWHIYGRNPGDIGLPTTVTWTLPSSMALGESVWPPETPFTFQGVSGMGYSNTITLAQQLKLINPQATQVSFSATVSMLVCKDICVPETAALELTLPVTESPRKNTVHIPQDRSGLWLFFSVMFSAFIGGIILNLMPCVFPILAIKTLSIIKSKDLSSTQRISQTMSYLAGIVSSFAVLGIVLIILRQTGLAVGWGFQLQSPLFVGIFMVILLLVGLNLWGILPAPLWLYRISGLGSSLNHKSHFYTGVLTTVITTPCTAPFMAPAIGYALSHSTIQALSVFIAMGVGLGFPFVVISIFPRLSALLPTPGPWMETFKKLLAIPMLLSALWLGWVLYQQVLPRDITVNTQWEAYSGETFDELQRTNTPFFLDATAAWCLTCQVNEKRVLETREVQALFKQNNICLIKADWTNQNPEITELLDSFNRSGVPFYLYQNGAGEQVILPQLLSKKEIFKLFQTH